MFEQVYARLERATYEIANSIVPPEEVFFGDGFRYRYQEKGLNQAIVLKLVRQASLLRAAKILCDLGHGHEQAILQRAMDESFEDVQFLCGPLLGRERTTRHDEYLDYFFQEEFTDPVDPSGSQNHRGMVSSEKIRAYNARQYSKEDVERASRASKTIFKAYSGFVHGHSVHILDLYGGNPPQFHMAGVLNTTRHGDHANDFENYPYRALVSATIAATAMKVEPTCHSLYRFTKEYEQTTGIAG